MRFLLAKARKVDPALDVQAVDLTLTDDRGIAAVNRRVFGRAGPTDVISLRYLPAIHETGGGSAELFLNVQRAVDEGRARQRRANAWGPDKELALYLAHGCDHLTGADDGDADARRRMRRRDLRWVHAAGAVGLLDALFDHGPR